MIKNGIQLEFHNGQLEFHNGQLEFHKGQLEFHKGQFFFFLARQWLKLQNAIYSIASSAPTLRS